MTAPNPLLNPTLSPLGERAWYRLAHLVPLSKQCVVDGGLGKRLPLGAFDQIALKMTLFDTYEYCGMQPWS